MDAKSLKKLNRRELLEVMVKISEQNESLEQENQKLRLQLENRRLSAREVGSLAQASLEATDLFIAADSAAKVYLENILRMEKESQERANKLLEETLTECIMMRAAAGFGPDELIPPDWRLPQEAAPAPVPVAESDPLPPRSEDELIVSFDSTAPVTTIPAADLLNDSAQSATDNAASSGPAHADTSKKKRKGLFSRKKKD